MGLDDAENTAAQALRRHALLVAWLDLFKQVDGPNRGRPGIPARSAIPWRRRLPARTLRLTARPHENHIAALTARLRRARPL